MKGGTWKILLIAVTIVASIVYLYPTLRLYSLSEEEVGKMREGDSAALDRLKDRAINLGLDLQGGVHMVLEVDPKGLAEALKVDVEELSDKDLSDAVDRAIEVIRNRIDEFGVREPVIHKEGRQRIVVELPGLQEIGRAKRLVGQTALLEFKMLESNEDRNSLLERIDAALAGPATPDTAKTEELFEEVEVTEKGRPFTSLLDGYGNDIVVRVERVDRVKGILADPKVQAVIPSDKRFLWASKPEVVGGMEIRRLYYLKAKPEMTGAMLADAKVERGSGLDPETAGKPTVNFTTTDDARKTLARVTGAHVGDRMAIVLDNKVYSAPVIRDKITQGRGEITGSETMDEARDLAIVLRAGALPSSLTTIEDRTVGPSLGKDSIEKGKNAALIGLAVVVVFMVLYYGLSGLVADLALVLNMVFIMAILAGFRATLTLPGIAGIILTIGMAVDANVLIFERIREELRTGKTVRAAIDSGYSRVFTTILDANITTLIAAVVLYQFGTGPIKGFALTLSIGVISSMFTALLVARVIFDYVTSRWRVRSLSIGRLGLLVGARFGFIDIRKMGFLLSVGVIAIGLFSLGIHKGPDFSIDFEGGTLLELHFDPPVSVEAVRDALGEVNIGGEKFNLARSEIKKFGSENDVLIRTEDMGEGMATADGIKARLMEMFPESLSDGDWLRRQEKVGPKIGGELKKDAVKTIIWALIFIVGYISWRFRHIRFGIAAVVALFHDVLITVGVFSLLSREVSLAIIAALLAIVGYSLNDTIVVFDRIRENLKASRREGYASVINRSINECLSRTLITSLTTLLVVLVLFFLGGEVIHDFALALMVGVLVGTYSSVFVASPILVEWQERAERKRAEARRARAAK